MEQVIMNILLKSRIYRCYNKKNQHRSFLFLLCITVVASEGSNSTTTTTTKIPNTKVVEKTYPKKVSSIKKNSSKTSLKKIADITEKFKDLPADDLAFIKELDKQFKLHGGKVKIKVENKNVTETKNSKRTIDGELGYGYAHNGYQYDPPKFMFYPYSQQNIGNNAPNYFLTGDGKTEVSIEPSYSYELKPQSYISHNEPQIDVPKPDAQQSAENFQPPQQQFEEPVIVLRIPGPAKYASHLQMLLQKYLEIRAAQYLRILEEAEQRNNQQQQQQQQHQLQQLDYAPGNNVIPDGHVENIEQHQSHVPISEQHDYQQQVQYDHQIAVTPQPIQYPEIDNVYQSYKNRHTTQPENIQQPLLDAPQYYTSQKNGEQQDQQQYQHQTQYQQQEHQPYQQQELQEPQYQQDQPQFYYTHQQQYSQPEGPPANTYQNVYILNMMPNGQSDYESSQTPPEKQQPIYVQDQSNQNDHSSSLPITENNPRPSHTKVLFTNNNEHTNQDYQMYQLPSIKPNERHAPTSVPDYHQDFQQPQQQLQNLKGKQDSQESSVNYQNNYNTAEPSNQEVVSITQRPFNYHAHGVKARARGRTAHARRAASAKDADKGLQKIRDFVREKLGAETGSAVEFKTTQVIDG
ncbi:uncharacterized protein ACRADG_006315 isoform 3-T3 [Cochliomyia hominivorax]